MKLFSDLFYTFSARRFVVSAVSFFLLGACSNPQKSEEVGDGGDFSQENCEANSLGEITLPEDDAFHNESFEWIYWTGHLQTEDGRWFGFEEALFQIGMGSTVMYLANFAITDVEDISFHYIGIPSFAEQLKTEDGFDLALENEDGKVRATGGNGTDQLSGKVDGYGLDITLIESKAPVPHHEDGYHQYKVGGYTYYYSRTRMAAEGTLTIDGVSHPVSGVAWFDHQWGVLQPVVNTGWDWLSLQLDDNRELMIFLVHDGNGFSLAGGTLVDSDCGFREIDPAELTVTELGSWTSPHTSCTYPSGWRVQTDDIDVEVTPILQDQELVSQHKTYWEGAALVTGTVTGRAYAELNGYCQ